MMRRTLISVLSWSLATTAAAALSWWSVRTVMAGTAYDEPGAVPLTSSDRAAAGSPSPLPGLPGGRGTTPAPTATDASGSPLPGGPPSRQPSGAATAPGNGSTPRPGRGDGTAPDATDPSPPAPPAPPAAPGKVEAYDVTGGRVVLELHADSAQLVSATPAPGWQMQHWKQDKWIRVMFSRGEDAVSVFCTWHDHAPMVTVDGG
ncbi:hypothetical protein ACMATS_17280 [Streptoverticillium reticulum]|uniref:hypothetical protein n=1 Tax=Streptoverticillium reticulum TaxID=1433415 RepID=UPI0039BF6C6D